MKYLGKIGIILLLIFTAGGFAVNDGEQGSGNITNSRIKREITTTSTNQTENAANSVEDEDDDDDAIYVCGDDDTEKKCTCINGTLSCNNGWIGYFQLSSLKHAKIKVRDQNFTAKIVDLRYNRLINLTKDEVLPGHESTIQELDLVFNDIEYIEDGAFDKFTSLKKLALAANSLQSMNATILTKQLGSTLEELDLSGNNLKNLSTNVFHHLSKLSFLNLRGNYNLNLVSKINGINVTIFAEALSNLKTLSLVSCNLRYLDDNVFINLRNIETLQLSYNRFTTIPKAIKTVSNLRHLYIDSSDIVSINDCDFCNLPNLKTLSITQYFSLTYIDENAFGALNNGTTVPQLDEFSIRFGSVSVIPEKLLNWKNISKIDISYNDLVCNCSMAWLINDYNATKPLYVDKFVNNFNQSYKDQLQCHSPKSLKGTHLHTLSGNFCKNDTAVMDIKEDIYYVCGNDEDDDTDIFKGCSCRGQTLDCEHYSSFLSNGTKLNHTNIQILKSNFKLEHADFVRNNITSLKKGKVLPGNEHTVKIILLASNQITQIENGTFDNFTALFGLDLNGNNLTNIDGLSFPTTLQRLSLRKTNLDHIPKINYSNVTYLDFSGNHHILSSSIKNIFPPSMAKLDSLHLYDCNITTLDDDIFVNLQSLKNLIIGNNPFTVVPTALNALQNLKHLNLNGLNITVLKNDSFVPLKNLDSLTATKSMLQKIDDCAFCNLPNLKILYLSGGAQLSYIHENAFGALTKEKPIQLETFAMESCNISTLPEKLLNWKNVSMIDIERNPLTCNCSMAWLINDYNASTPKYVNNLKSHYWDEQNKYDIQCTNPPELKNEYLYKLSGDFCLNEITNVEDEKIYEVCGENYGDAETESNCKCEYKYINCNSMNSTNIQIISNKSIEITVINIVYGNISHLNLKKLVPEKQHLIENLSFYHSNISSIETGTFDNFTSLKNLDLSDNNLTIIDANILTEQLGSTLLELNLGFNNLTSLSSQMFMHFTKLETLKLYYNHQISNYITSEIFSTSLSSLESLFLTGCNISSLPDDAFINLKNLSFLSLSYNPLTTFPTAINSLPNLNILEIASSNITVLSKKNLNINKNLKYIFAQSSKIQRIEECAFCTFPNLRVVDIDFNENLSFIHENAFGYAHSHIKPSLTLMMMDGCNLTTLPQNLFNWTTVRFRAAKNPFICDCSMKWFIDLIKSKFSASHHPHYQCHSQNEFKGKTFYGLPDSFCNESTTTTSTIPITSTLPSTIIALTDASTNSIQSYRQLIISILSIFVVISMVTVVAGIYYYRSRRVIQIRRNGKEGGEEDLLEEDFDVENV